MHRAGEPMDVPDIADEPPQAGVVCEVLANFILFEFVTGVDDYAPRVMMIEKVADESLAERAGSAGDQDRRSI
jgi:hypothetical protein